MWNVLYTFQSIADCNKTDAAWLRLGDQLNAEIWHKIEKMSFARRCLDYKLLAVGDLAVVGGKPIFEFALDSCLSLPSNQPITIEVLEELYDKAILEIMIPEEKLFLDALTLRAQDNSSIKVYNKFDYDVFTDLKSYITGAHSCLLSMDLWQGIVNDSRFASGFKPALNYQSITWGGYLGSMDGIHIYTDAFRPFDHRILQDGDIYIMNEAQLLGALRQRAELNTVPINLPSSNATDCSWVSNLVESFALLPSGVIAKGELSSLSSGVTPRMKRVMPSYIQTKG